MTTDTKTVALVPLKELIDLAHAGQAMRKAQRRYFDARKAGGRNCNDLLRWSFHAERLFDEACTKALHREKAALPGMEADGGVPADSD